MAPSRLDAILHGEAEDRVRLRALPGFARIVRGAASKLCTCYQGDHIFSRLMNDRGRLTLFSLMIDMHFEPASAQGLTSGRLKAEASALDICSPGRVTAVLAACRMFGLVAAAPDADRRRRRLVITDKLLDMHKARWGLMLEALAEMRPEGALGLRHLHNTAFIAPYAAALLEPLREGWRPIVDVPSIEMFVDRDGGLMLAFALFGNAERGTPLSAAGLARTYRLSRSHIVDILQKAVESGLARRVDDRAQGGPGFVAEPALIEAMESLMATALVRQSRAVRRGLEAVEP
ncbi:hypothetical protein G3A50_00250 [Ancylobacter pratisalsi]|uniref:Uncharacterized protein n=1 Tax=Ancylobacter pratisalsi TaxID=1745854 RepID=A0A6P1YT47_9HYPH|nr:hypothetical protein G3A50_00250 [Ancylobacter pratisalsi]